MARSLMSAIVELKPDMASFRKETVKGVSDAVDDAERQMDKGFGDAGKSAGAAAGKGIEHEIGKAAEKSSKTFAEKMRGIESAGRKMSMFVTAPILAGFGGAIKQASSLGEAVNATGVIFGSATANVDKWSKTTIDTLGLAQSTSLAMVNQLGAQMTAQGISQDQAAKMSMQLVERARDIKSLLNASSTEEVMTAIAAGLRGESEPMRRFGVALSQASIEAKALSMGLVQTEADLTKVKAAEIDVMQAQQAYQKVMKDAKATELDRADALNKVEQAEGKLAAAMEGKAPKLTEAQKIEAAYALVLEQSAMAEGDYANTKDSVANATERQGEQVKELAAAFGQQLLPIAEKVLKWSSEMLTKFQNLSPETKKVVTMALALAATLGPLLIIGAKFAQAIMTIRTAMLAMNAAFLANPVTLLIAAIVAAGIIIYKFRKQIWDFIKYVWDGFKKLGGYMAEPFKKLAGIVSDVFGGIVTALKTVVNGFLTYWETLINGAVKGINLLVRGANIVNPLDDIPYVPEVSLPRLATGGTVYPDGRVVQLAEGGEPEDVVPHSKRGAYASSIMGGMSEQLDRLAAAVSELAAQPRTMSVTVQGGAFNEKTLAAELDRLSRHQNAVKGRSRRPAR